MNVISKVFVTFNNLNGNIHTYVCILYIYKRKVSNFVLSLGMSTVLTYMSWYVFVLIVLTLHRH